ncbi:MAG: hypothetical protein HY791_23245 [Deltaproteobacteria bacterium]|nr:hypothetical protein [Deltaproteobacteria bacterium]
MKHELPLGTLELPEGYEDRSSYQFLSAPSTLDAPLARGRGSRIEGMRLSVLLTRVPLVGGKLEDVLGAQENGFRQTLPGVTSVARSRWKHPKLGAVPIIELAFEPVPGHSVKQTHCYFSRDKSKDVVTLTFTTDGRDKGAFESQIAEVFEAFALQD